jgi:hypothetical protein
VDLSFVSGHSFAGPRRRHSNIYIYIYIYNCLLVRIKDKLNSKVNASKTNNLLHEK